MWEGHTAQRVVADIRRRLLDTAPAVSRTDIDLADAGVRQAANA
jgi:hypothetical protein